MPELPEVEVIRCTLEPLIMGKTFVSPVLYMSSTIEYPGPEEFCAFLSGRRVERIGRKGKYLLIDLDRGFLAIHLRMTGNLIYCEREQTHEDRFLRIGLPFSDGSALYFSDMRRFGRIWLVESEEELALRVLKNVGPDILDEVDRDKFCRLLAKRNSTRLKTLLLDQKFIAGMGNIYTDECLHRCGLHPLRQAGTLERAEVEKLYAVIREVLAEGIEFGGTSIRNYRNAAGALGDFQSRLAVYGRRGEHCRCCGAVIEKINAAGRGTYYCPRCQKISGHVS